MWLKSTSLKHSHVPSQNEGHYKIPVHPCNLTKWTSQTFVVFRDGDHKKLYSQKAGTAKFYNEKVNSTNFCNEKRGVYEFL